MEEILKSALDVRMDADTFWQLIELSADHGPDRRSRVEWLTQRLAQRPLSEMEEFQLCFDQCRAKADTWLMWGAAYQTCDSYCSGDGYWYFLAG